MKFFLVTLGVIVALILWFALSAIAAVWVGATFGENWKAIPIAIGAAPVGAGILLFTVGDS